MDINKLNEIEHDTQYSLHLCCIRFCMQDTFAARDDRVSCKQYKI